MPSKTIVPPEPAYIVKNSRIHGRGLYASRDINKGERVVEYVGEKVTKAESDRRGKELMAKSKTTGGGAVYMFILNKNFDIDGNVDYNDARLVNHSCDPNCESEIIRGKIWYMAIKDIAAGEELSLNYGFGLDDWDSHVCRCGAPKCVGYIVAEEHWPELRREIQKRNAASRRPPLAGRKPRRSKHLA